MRALVLLVLVACNDDARVKPSPSQRPLPLKPQAPVFAYNRGRPVVESRVPLRPEKPGTWEGSWSGTQELLDGAVSGSLPVDMTITRMRDGQLRLTQNQFGVRVDQYLVPNPDEPQIAAGVSRQVVGAGSVTVTSRAEITAIVSGDQIVLGALIETEGSGSYEGTELPKLPPSHSLTLLQRNP